MIDIAEFAVLGPLLGFGGNRLRRETEQARYGLDHLQLSLDTVPEAMIVIDEKDIIRSFTAAAVRLFGWSPDDVVGMNVSRLTPQLYRAEHERYIKRYLTNGERHIIGIGRIVVGERSDGSTSVGEVKVRGERFFTGFIRKRIKGRAQERRLQELQSELVHVSRLTAMGEMASSIAHEINRPLSAITNYMRGAEALLAPDKPDTNCINDALEHAAQQALRAKDIIKRLREFVAKGEHTVETPLTLLEEAVALALVGPKEQGVRVMIRSDRDLPLIVDEIQIQQVALNLIRNAIEAIASCPRRELTVEVAKVDRFTVADKGPGISPGIADRLFQPFVTTKKHGLGVGLSICRTIVESHGGHIVAETNPGGGTIFQFTPPFVEVSEET
ncbi:two-component system, LuxR family, sensor kinase FixL [Bradyrhizobium sp. Rc2d]|uniref:sensor histidine kinase n=1 Tax=Bradyrhizobium sp. Rc2d TaxID=1855321 RepID=UPI0008903A72|nr:ATP-binding protein [Bradyrhizobium sp. Rc2d]SDJ12660.1 two-component system, LuxR family, sensor kinase FixL [Bradyrhizobium sp. Rc2d]